MPTLDELAAKHGGAATAPPDLTALAAKHGGAVAGAETAPPAELPPLTPAELVQLTGTAPEAGATMAQLQAAQAQAQAQGDTETAQRLAAFIEQASQAPENLIPGLPVTGTQVPPPEPTLGEQAVGAGETALTLGTGATAGAIGYLGGALKGIAEEILSGRFGQGIAEAEAIRGAEKFTYAPRTAAGQEMTEATGEALAPLQAVAPLTPELSTVAEAARAAAPLARAVARPAMPEAAQAPGTGRAAGARPAMPEAAQAPGTGRAAGAQAVGKETVRQAQAEELPVPIKLTEGQKTRTFEQQRFERETAKLPEAGAPLRERFEKQNLQLQQNLDAFIDRTGAELADVRGVGEVVDKALKARAAKDKTKIRTLYKDAEKAGELSEPVDLQGLVDVLNENVSAEATAPILSATKKELVRLGGAVEDESGNLVPFSKGKIKEISGELSPKDEKFLRTANDLLTEATNADEADALLSAIARGNNQPLKKYIIEDLSEGPDEPFFQAVPRWEKPGIRAAEGEASAILTLKDSEQLRKFINKVTGQDPTNIKFAGDLKRAIDAATEGMGGNKYKQARAARAKYAREYENIGLVKRLIGTKRGSDDRAIAMEDVLNKVVLSPSTSLDEMRHVRRLLQTKAGEGGKQAWRELQGGTLREIRDAAYKSVATDQTGNQVLSPAALDRMISRLDRTGKLDFIFGKRGAEQLRVINDVAKDVATSPPGVVNNSNTASVLAGLMDVAISGSAGVPAPIMTSFRLVTKSIKDAKLKARVKKALGE